MFVSIWGFMGAGKSTIGKAFANQYTWQHVDSDEQIEQQEKIAIHIIFELYGENRFRELETYYLQNLFKKKQELKEEQQNILLTTGGGMPVRDDNRKLLKKLGKTIYIHVPFDEIVERLRTDQQRPLWDNEQIEIMRERYETRLPIYLTADHTILAQDKTVDELVEEIANLIR
jgi:shikimate kinase